MKLLRKIIYSRPRCYRYLYCIWVALCNIFYNLAADNWWSRCWSLQLYWKV